MALIDLIPTSIRLSMARTLMKSAGLPIAPAWLRSSFFEPTWRNLIRQGYKANAAVYGCIGALAMAFPEPEMKVFDLDGKPLPKHPLQKMLRRPNSFMSEAEFNTYCITWLAIGGNLYIHKQRNMAGQVRELLPFHAGQIMPVPGGPSWIDHYEYDNGSGSVIRVPREDIIHIKWPLPDPEQPWMATPPLLHAAREVDTDNEATAYLFALLKNDAVTRTVIEMPPGAQQMDRNEVQRIKADFGQGFGSDKRGSVGVVQGGAKISRVALNMEELAFEALHNVPEARIAAAFRVPPIVAGLNVGLEHGTLANYREAVTQMTEGTLVPLWRLVDSEISQSLGEDYGGEVEVHRDLSKVRALQENETEKWKRLDIAVAGGWVKKNEAREAIGLVALPEYDAVPAAAGDDDSVTDAAEVEKSLPEIFAYHIEQQVVTRNEVRERLGLPPKDDQEADRLLDFLNRVKIFREAVDAGIDPEEALGIVGLDGVELADEPSLPPDVAKALASIQQLEIKDLRTIESKADRVKVARRAGKKLQQIRLKVGKQMEPAIDAYFAELADRIAARAEAYSKSAALMPANGNGNGHADEAKALPPISALLTRQDDKDLEKIIKKFYAELLELSWPIWNTTLGTVVDFELIDPVVTEILDGAGKRVRQINETTRSELAELLKEGNRQGWSIEQFIRGDPNADPPIRGIRDIVPETYKGRSRNIARTELGTAQQQAAVRRYERAGVTKVLVLDNGFNDSHEECRRLGNQGKGTIKSLEWANNNPLQHPGCVRAFAPHFED